MVARPDIYVYIVRHCEFQIIDLKIEGHKKTSVFQVLLQSD